MITKRAVVAVTAGMLLLAACDNIISEAETPLDKIPLSSIIRVSVTPAGTVSTDTSAVVIARIPTNAANRTVSFSSSSGLFDETLKNAVTVLAVPDPADTTLLLARAVLRDSQAEHVIVRAAVGTTYYDTVGVTFVNPQ